MIFSTPEVLLRSYYLVWSAIPGALVNHSVSKLVTCATLALLSNDFMVLHFVFLSKKGQGQHLLLLPYPLYYPTQSQHSVQF